MGFLDKLRRVIMGRPPESAEERSLRMLTSLPRRDEPAVLSPEEHALKARAEEEGWVEWLDKVDKERNKKSQAIRDQVEQKAKRLVERNQKIRQYCAGMDAMIRENLSEVGRRTWQSFDLRSSPDPYARGDTEAIRSWRWIASVTELDHNEYVRYRAYYAVDVFFDDNGEVTSLCVGDFSFGWQMKSPVVNEEALRKLLKSHYLHGPIVPRMNYD